jgi:glutamyl-tRNA synthetase
VTPDPVRVRFAPSPTGYLHIGGARTALFNWLFARQQGGQFVLRIEDTDTERSKPELIDVIFQALEWLGLDWDGTPVHQSERSELYAAAIEKLLADGSAYWCDCTPDAVKARAEQRGGPPGYDGFCRDRGLGRGEGHVVRFRVPDDGTTAFDDVIRGHVSFENAVLEDFVIQRSNGTPMFHLANAVDDADQGITHVVRGEDLINVTPKVLLLRDALHITGALTFAHLPLIVNEKRQKLSKRRDDVSVGDYIDRGYLAEAMVNYLATLGWGAPDGIEIRPLPEIVELFRLTDVGSSGAFFDVKKLQHFNGEYIRALSVPQFVSASTRWLFDDPPWPPERFDVATFEVLAPLVQERVKLLSEVPGYVDFVFAPEPTIDEASWQKVMGKGAELAVAVLDHALVAFEGCTWDVASLEPALFAYAEANDVSRGKVQAPVRVAVTGRTVGPPLFESLEVLGRDETLRRLRAARSRL